MLQAPGAEWNTAVAVVLAFQERSHISGDYWPSASRPRRHLLPSTPMFPHTSMCRLLSRLHLCGPLALLLLITSYRPLIAQSPAPGPARVEQNVVFDMYSGLSLLTDVYYPAGANGRGVVVITGTAWYGPAGYPPLSPKDSQRMRKVVTEPLLAAGYTVFMPNHRLTPAFTYPAPIKDVQRAIRFIRENARRFGVRADSLAGVGMSSGGHLLSLAGVLDGDGNPDSPDPVSRHSGKLQCVVSMAGPTDLARIRSSIPQFFALLLGGALPPGGVENTEEFRLYRDASPVEHVSADDAEFLIIHGDQDDIVPFQQAEVLEAAIRRAGGQVRVRRVPGAGHGLLRVENHTEFIGEAVAWLDQCMGVEGR